MQINNCLPYSERMMAHVNYPLRPAIQTIPLHRQTVAYQTEDE